MYLYHLPLKGDLVMISLMVCTSVHYVVLYAHVQNKTWSQIMLISANQLKLVILIMLKLLTTTRTGVCKRHYGNEPYPARWKTLQTLSFCLNTSWCHRNANVKIKSEPRILITCVCQDVKMQNQPLFKSSHGDAVPAAHIATCLTSLFMLHVFQPLFDIAVKTWVEL